MTQAADENPAIEVSQSLGESRSELSLLAPIPGSTLAPLVLETRGVDKMIADLLAASSDITS